jgi:hypothetical protein
MKIARALLHLDRPSRSMPEPMAKDSNARCEFPLKVSPFFFEDVIMQMCLGGSPNGSFSSAEVQVIRFNRPRDWGNHIAMQASQFAFNVSQIYAIQTLYRELLWRAADEVVTGKYW